MNGVAERANRTIVEKARTMLQETSLNFYSGILHPVAFGINIYGYRYSHTQQLVSFIYLYCDMFRPFSAIFRQ
jgi:hypothetical protein